MLALGWALVQVDQVALMFSLGCRQGWGSAKVVQVFTFKGCACSGGNIFRCSAFPTPQQSTREHGEEAEQYDKFGLHGWLL